MVAIRYIFLWFSFVFSVCCPLFVSAASSEKSQAQEVTEIRNLLENWTKDFNAKKFPETCKLFAPDLFASYLGAPERNYDDMCQHLKKALFNPQADYKYDFPQIEEILIADNLAVVRLIWTLTINEKTPKDDQKTPKLIIKENGIDIFKRQKDGTWKISISYAYPLLVDAVK